MGLIKAGLGAINGVMADQWKEFFYCDAIDSNTLVRKATLKTSKRSSNTKGENNIISNGSVIAIADGQFMMIVDQGKVVEFSAEPGEFTYDTSSEPSIFTGNLSDEIKKTFDSIGDRFKFGGAPGKNQRVYYVNMKEIVGNKYGTATPVPFRVVDRNIGLDIDISIRCNGEYSYRIIDPILFYTNVCGNIDGDYDRSNIDSMLRSELMTALQPAFAKISEVGIRYSALPGHTEEIAAALNQVLSEKWKNMRGIEIASFGINSVSAPKEDEDMIKGLQKNAVMRDPTMAAATLVGAQAQAMQDAAKNSGGAFMGFAGMNAAQANGGMDANNLFSMGRMQKETTSPQPSADGWICTCGTENKGNFCTQCAAPKPASGKWTCTCGTVNTGKFCAECGKQGSKPLSYKCNKCGWKPEGIDKLPKFCPECGDPFNNDDIS